MNITATVHSNSPLVSLNLGVKDRDLPPHTKNHTYSDGAAVYTTLEMKSLCYSDSGNYTITATTEYATSVEVAPLHISKGS